MAGKPAGRFGDIHSGHGCFAPTPCIKASTNVMTNKRGAMRVGDMFVVHCCGLSCHQPILAQGSSKVIINGRPAGRMTDMVGCGAKVMIGSTNVLIGG